MRKAKGEKIRPNKRFALTICNLGICNVLLGVHLIMCFALGVGDTKMQDAVISQYVFPFTG
jgi:hypothetical protein